VAYNNRGYDWYMKGDYDKAIADFNQALVLCPKYAAVYSNRGVAWDAKKEQDQR
jgi:tetratricopeptide (TPR) repeat protein